MSTAAQVWQELQTDKSNLLSKCERFAALTLPRVCLPEGFNHTQEQSHDWQSMGAQACNHVINKMMLSLFHPGQPFFKLDPSIASEQELAAAGIEPTDAAELLATAERKALQELEQTGQRPKLFQGIEHLIVTGNVLMCLLPEGIRAMGLRYYGLKRNILGEPIRIVTKEELPFRELEQDVQDHVGNKLPDTKVSFYKMIERVGDDMHLSQWVDNTRLPEAFDGKWPKDECPYVPLAWNLADEADYGTGLVEDYVGDFEALSALSEAGVTGTVQATEMRWMVSPTGQTDINDFNKSRNGDALAGLKEDINPVQAGNVQAIQAADSMMSRYEQRISRGFLMAHAVTRNAERVTAEEIRLQAMELDTAYGGTWSRQGATFQPAVARWLLSRVGIGKLDGFKLTIVTGLDALSRNGELEALRAAFGDLAQFSVLPPELQARINFRKVADFVGRGRGIKLSDFLYTDSEFATIQQQQAQARVAESTATAAGEAAVQPGASQQ